MAKEFQKEIKKRSEFTFPELRDQEKHIRKIPLEDRIITGSESAESVFGTERMKDKKFKRELRRFQEKYKYKGLA